MAKSQILVIRQILLNKTQPCKPNHVLEKLNPKIDGVRIGHSVGTKKRKEIVIKSIEKKFKIFNARVSERASKS